MPPGGTTEPSPSRHERPGGADVVVGNPDQHEPSVVSVTSEVAVVGDPSSQGTVVGADGVGSQGGNEVRLVDGARPAVRAVVPVVPVVLTVPVVADELYASVVGGPEVDELEAEVEDPVDSLAAPTVGDSLPHAAASAKPPIRASVAACLRTTRVSAMSKLSHGAP